MSHSGVLCWTISTGTSASSSPAPVHTAPTSSAEKWCGPAPVLQPAPGSPAHASTTAAQHQETLDTATSQAYVVCFIPFDPSPALSTVSTGGPGPEWSKSRAQAWCHCQCWSQCHASHSTTAHILLWCG